MAYKVWKVNGYLKDGRHVLAPIAVGARGIPTYRLPIATIIDDLTGIEAFTRRMLDEEPARTADEEETTEAIRQVFRALRIRSWKAMYRDCAAYSIVRVKSGIAFSRAKRDPKYGGFGGDDSYPPVPVDLSTPGQLSSLIRHAFYS
jgi:hypothetical protein